jgi:hypothetical protein
MLAMNSAWFTQGWAKRIVILNRLRTEVEKFAAPDQFRLPATFTEKKNQRPVSWWGREVLPTKVQRRLGGG